jgi:hypothetical protein
MWMLSRSSAARATIGCASRAKHALNAGVHLVFFNELAARNLLNANLHLSLKALGIGEHLRDSFLHELARCPTGLSREGIQLSFLLLGQMEFHTISE